MTIFLKDNNKNEYKIIAYLLGGILLISLIPVLYCFFFVYANGDDLWEGQTLHRLFIHRSSWKEVVSGIKYHFVSDYMTWEGNWSSIILWMMEPSVWGEKVYLITPWIGLSSICGGIGYFTYYYNKKYVKATKYVWMTVYLLILFFAFQYMPSIKNGLFWYTGMINYMFPLGWTLAVLVWIDLFLDTGKNKYIIFMTIAMTYISGAGYIMVVVCFEMMVFAIAWQMLNVKKNKRYLKLFIPFFLFLIGFALSALSPGNAARAAAAGQEYGVNLLSIVVTILQSLKMGLIGSVQWALQVRPFVFGLGVVFLLFLFMDSEDGLSYKHPFLTMVFLYLVCSSVYAPMIYSGDEVSGGVYNSIYITFLICSFMGVAYLGGWSRYILLRKNRLERWILNPNKRKKILYGYCFASIIVLGLLGKHIVGNSAAYLCGEFIKSGQLRDYVSQMEERIYILNNSSAEIVYLPQMNDEQGPYMHMPITIDSQEYTNRATQVFYEKKEVIGMPRREFYDWMDSLSKEDKIYYGVEGLLPIGYN